jgi:multimeric flavodoxin WrbA
MNKKVLAILGTYRRGGISDQIVEAVLKAAREKGAETEKIYLLDKHIEFCKNCRDCCETNPEELRGQCVLKDDMDGLLAKMDAADSLVLASPINFYTVTAIMKRFAERLTVYAYWPWEQGMPKARKQGPKKKAVVVTSSACPAFIARLLMPNATKILKDSAQILGAKVVKSIHFGTVCQTEDQKLNKRQAAIAEAAGQMIVSG